MLNKQEQTLYLIALTKIPGVGDARVKKLVAYCGGAKEVFTSSRAFLEKIPNIGKAVANAVSAANVLQLAEDEIAFANEHGISAISFLDDAYPQRLKHCDDAPIVFILKETGV